MSDETSPFGAGEFRVILQIPASIPFSSSSIRATENIIYLVNQTRLDFAGVAIKYSNGLHGLPLPAIIDVPNTANSLPCLKRIMRNPIKKTNQSTVVCVLDFRSGCCWNSEKPAFTLSIRLNFMASSEISSQEVAEDEECWQ